MPAVLAADASQRLMVLEDLGATSDYSTLYSSHVDASEVDAVFQHAIDWVARLHKCDVVGESSLGCRPLLELNHQYFFRCHCRIHP